jgi:SAM-dependent methyltransferase
MEKLSACRICSSLNIEELKPIQSPYFDISYILYHCKECNSKFFNPLDHDISLDEMYQKFDSENLSHYTSNSFKKNRLWIHQKNIITKLLKKEPVNVLDVGCRTGEFLLHFNDSTLKEGVELSAHYAEIGKKRGITVHTDFIENIDFKEQFDVVTCYALLEHIVDPKLLIDKLKQIVKPNGIFVILVPSHECFKEKFLYALGIQWYMFTPPAHFNYFSKKSLNNIVTKNDDFKLVKSFKTSGGIFNPFKKVPFLNKVFGYFMFLFDSSPLNQIPLFDHLYVYYQKK